jgi:Putative MetA-pathway of phenol degradation
MHVTSFVFVSLVAVCMGCQSFPAIDRSSVVSNDLSLPALPSAEEGGDGDSDPRRASDLDPDPLADSLDRERRPFLGFPIGKLLDDSTDDDDPSQEDPSGVRSIRSPGPDISNFPNSPFTLRQGRFYIETSPVFISGPSRGTPATYNAEFLLRYGLTDRVELRLFSNGPTFERGPAGANGMAPLAWDIKTNLWEENLEYHIPAVGLEVFLLTPSGSKKINQGTQPSINLLFAHTLPFKIELEWNVGLVGDPSPNNSFSSIEPAAAWAFEREIFKNFYGFLQGYFNGPTLPRYGDGVELGGGVRWTISRRFALWASYNGGVSKEAPTTIFYAGCAIAF